MKNKKAKKLVRSEDLPVDGKQMRIVMEGANWRYSGFGMITQRATGGGFWDDVGRLTTSIGVDLRVAKVSRAKKKPSPMVSPKRKRLKK